MSRLKFVVLALFATVISFSSYATSSSEEDVDNYKSLIMSYVKAEGYMPSIDSDGDVEFKQEGSKYWIQVSSYDNGYYVTVMTMTSRGDVSQTKARKLMDETMSGLKYVRMYTLSDGKTVKISYSWYCVSISDFKRMFSNALNVVSTADNKFIQGLLSEQ